MRLDPKLAYETMARRLIIHAKVASQAAMRQMVKVRSAGNPYSGSFHQQRYTEERMRREAFMDAARAAKEAILTDAPRQQFHQNLSRRAQRLNRSKAQ